MKYKQYNITEGKEYSISIDNHSFSSTNLERIKEIIDKYEQKKLTNPSPKFHPLREWE